MTQTKLNEHARRLAEDLPPSESFDALSALRCQVRELPPWPHQSPEVSDFTKGSPNRSYERGGSFFLVPRTTKPRRSRAHQFKPVSLSRLGQGLPVVISLGGNNPSRWYSLHVDRLENLYDLFQLLAHFRFTV